MSDHALTLTRLLVPGAFCALVTAQEPTPETPVDDGSGTWIVRAQAEDGRWPAAGPDGGRRVRDLRATALAMLGILADGSTLDAGPHRGQLRKACRWLRDSQDPQGRFAPHAEPDWILDHAMATYAVLETTRLGGHEPPVGMLSAVDALTTGLHPQRGKDVSAELLLWSMMCARSAAASQAGEPWTEARSAVRREIDRLRPRRVVPEPLHERAALLLLESMEGPIDDERLTELAKPFLDPGWPDETADPRAVLYYSLACFRQGGAAWRRLSKRLTEAVVRTQVRAGEHEGTWDPVGLFGKDGGRMCTTATHVLTLTVYYRYCNLLVVAE